MIFKGRIKKIYYSFLNKLSKKEPGGQELINRYRSNYGIPLEVAFTEDIILEHWNLEKQLTQELLDSTPTNRWEVFDRCYTTLYSKPEWLNKYIDRDKEIYPETLYKDWAYLIGSPAKKFMKWVPVEVK